MPDKAVRNTSQIAKVRSFGAVGPLVTGNVASSLTVGREDIAVSGCTSDGTKAGTKRLQNDRDGTTAEGLLPCGCPYYRKPSSSRAGPTTIGSRPHNG